MGELASRRASLWAAEPRAESIASSGSSLLCKNFKLLCKFHLQQNGAQAGAGRRGNQPKAGNRQPAAACRQSAVWREQKRQANAIIQVAAVISCLISIINTRHRHGRQIPDSPPSFLSPFLCASNRTMGTNHFICQPCGLLLLVLLAQSSRTVAREFRLAMQYFILEQTSTRSFFLGSQSCHRTVCLSVVVVFFRLFCQLSAAMNLII